MAGSGKVGSGGRPNGAVQAPEGEEPAVAGQVRSFGDVCLVRAAVADVGFLPVRHPGRAVSAHMVSEGSQPFEEEGRARLEANGWRMDLAREGQAFFCCQRGLALI